MIKNLKTISIGIIIGLVIGLWLGVNIGKNQSIFSNPFIDKPLHKKLLNSSGNFLEKSGRAIKDSVNKP